MAHTWSTIRRHDRDQPASPAVARLIVLVFLIASAMGCLAGLGWMAWTMLRRAVGGYPWPSPTSAR